MRMNKKMLGIGLVGIMLCTCVYGKSCFDTDKVIYEKLMQELEMQKENPLQYNIPFGIRSDVTVD